jgi:DNA-directed RNA polymerase III subunit RPC1
MSSYGMKVDLRHMKLLADIMSYKGEILGITRYGISKIRDSVLMLASFERTTDHLFDAAVHSRHDSVEGVSECIIMGMPIGNGTGIFKLLQQVQLNPREKQQPIFATVNK